MDTKNLKAFKTVYETGSITKAAAQLYITQQGLSRIIAKLEAELGQSLFERTTHGVEPTVYAQALYRKAGKLTALLESVLDEATAESDRTQLNVASVTGVLLYTGLGLIEDFECAYPDIELRIDEMSDKRVADQLREGSADIGLMAGPVDRALWEAVLFSRHRHVIVMAENDPLASREIVSVADLDQRVVTLLGRDYTPYANNLRRFAEAGIQPERLVEHAEGNTGLQLAASGQALCICTDYAAFATPLANTVVRPFGDKECSWDVFVVWPRGVELNKPAAAFREFAPTWVRNHHNTLFSWEYSTLENHI